MALLKKTKISFVKKQLKKTKTERDVFSDLEQVAKLLVKRLSSFEYSYKYIKILDDDVRDATLAENVSYDVVTGEVVIASHPSGHQIEVRHSDFVKYMNSAK